MGIRVSMTVAAVSCAVALIGGCAPPASYDGLPPGEATSSGESGGDRELGTSTPRRGAPSANLERVWDGFRQPLHVAAPPDGSGRVFVVEKTGRIMEARDGGEHAVYLDLSDTVSTDSERGVLSIAFDPGFASNARVYVYYTRRDGATVVSRFTESGGRLDAASEEVLLTVSQPYANHNGGQLAFGPEGYLYVSLGDGGSGGDPQDHGQDPGSLLGTMVRIDVSGAQGYAIPSDNPFVGGDGAPEVWAWGLRNPWRASFDAETGDLWIGDVGQNALEEIDRVPAGSEGGLNFGWRVWEGTQLYEGDDPRPDDPVWPVYEYGRDEGVSVTGGFVYRGSDIPDLSGWYVFGDFGSGAVWALDALAVYDGRPPEVVQLFDTGLAISSFGVDGDGELYLTDLDSGGVYRFLPE